MEGGLKVISPLDGGGQEEVILTLIQGGGCNFILRPTLLILETPPPDNYCTVPYFPYTLSLNEIQTCKAISKGLASGFVYGSCA